MKGQPFVPRYQYRLGDMTAWHCHVRAGGTACWRRRWYGYLLAPVYELINWVRWKAGRGPWCGDEFCWREDHWPGGKVKHP